MQNTPGARFARRLREERERAGLSQADLAGRLSDVLNDAIYHSAVARMESGKRSVKIDEAIAIADVLGVRLAELLEDRDTVDDRIDELQIQLVQYREAVTGYEEQLHRARSSVSAVEQEIAELESSRVPPDSSSPNI